MSDSEDDRMEVDSAAIQFSSNNTNAKGKRTHANLPVEAEDTLPW
jgi:replication factor C subunit 3/5